MSFGERADGHGFGLAVAMKVTLPDLDCDQAVEPYSNAKRGNIDVEFTGA